MCETKKTSYSKHCIICNKCIEGFDHHCYWVNNCIGKENLYLFVSFIAVVNINLVYTIAISIMSLVTDINSFSSNNTFPPPLPWSALYKDSAKTVISAAIIIIGIFFLFPVL